MILQTPHDQLLPGLGLSPGHRAQEVGDGHQSLVDTIVDAVARAIVQGEYPPGKPINSVMLADRFQTSRTPVREAMLVLERHGLVEIPPRRQARVAAIGQQEVREIYELQAHLLGMVFELCARNAKEDQLAALRASFQGMAAAAEQSDDEAYFWANIAFHDVAAAASGNATLKQILDPLRLRTLQLRRITLGQPGRLERSLAEHARLLDACERGEPELAAAIIRALSRSALALLEELQVAGKAPTARRAPGR